MTIEQKNPDPVNTDAPQPKPPTKPRKKRGTPTNQVAAAAADKLVSEIASETAAERRARERKEELAEAEHEEKLSGFRKTKWLRYLVVLATSFLITASAAFVWVYLKLSIKAGTPFDASVITGVFTTGKDLIQILFGL